MAQTNTLVQSQKTSSTTIKASYDISKLNQKLEDYKNTFRKQLRQTVLNATTTAIAAGVRYTPPNIGKTTIEKKYWTRPVVYIPSLIKSGSATKEDIEMLRKGFLYKVIHTKAGVKKGTAFAYCKKLSQTKKFAKIATRGMSRVMWGKNLGKIGAKVPANISALLKKSPKLQQINLNDVKLDDRLQIVTVEVTNKDMNVSQSARQIAINQSIKKFKNDINKQVKKTIQQQKVKSKK